MGRAHKRAAPSFGAWSTSTCSAAVSDLPLTARLFARGENLVESAMWLIVYYLVFMVIGDICAYLIGLATEAAFGSQASLIVFLSLYFAFLWVSWLLAVWVTEPKHATAAAKSA
jgi:cation transporter-like permease